MRYEQTEIVDDFPCSILQKMSRENPQTTLWEG